MAGGSDARLVAHSGLDALGDELEAVIAFSLAHNIYCSDMVRLIPLARFRSPFAFHYTTHLSNKDSSVYF